MTDYYRSNRYRYNWSVDHGYGFYFVTMTVETVTTEVTLPVGTGTTTTMVTSFEPVQNRTNTDDDTFQRKTTVPLLTTRSI